MPERLSMTVRLTRDIAAVIAAKLVLLTALYFFFFAERPAPHDAPATAAHIIGAR
jgi:hypothetical protein